MGKYRITDKELKNLAPKSTAYKVRIDSNFYLVVYPSGKKSYRLRAYNNSSETTITLGCYPDLSLKEATERYKELHKPSTIESYFQKVDSKTFEEYAKLYMLEKQVSGKYSKTRLERFENHIFPYLAHLKMHQITNKLVKKIVMDIQASGKLVTGQRCLTLIKQVFDHCSSEDCDVNLNFSAIRKCLINPKPKNFTAATKVSSLKKVLSGIKEMNVSEMIRLNILLGMHWFLRPGEIASLRWSDISYEDACIYFKPSKNGNDNVIPLNKTTLGYLQRLQMLSNDSDYLFPSPVKAGEAICSESATTALRRNGIQQTMHGFRATARTLIVEKLKFDANYVEKQLSHKTRNPNGTAYDRTEHLEKRAEMMATWSDFLAELQSEI